MYPPGGVFTLHSYTYLLDYQQLRTQLDTKLKNPLKFDMCVNHCHIWEKNERSEEKKEDEVCPNPECREKRFRKTKKGKWVPRKTFNMVDIRLLMEALHEHPVLSKLIRYHQIYVYVCAHVHIRS